MLAEPTASEAAPAIREMLEPHGLDLVERDGILLVVRTARPAPEAPATGSLLILVRGPDAGFIEAPLEITTTPNLPAPDNLGAGMFQFRAAPPGHYDIRISGAGYQGALRQARIIEDETVSLSVRLASGPAELETLTVSTSRYVLQSNSQFFHRSKRAIQNLPDIGDDPIRSVHQDCRVPPRAAGPRGRIFAVGKRTRHRHFPEWAAVARPVPRA